DPKRRRLPQRVGARREADDAGVAPSKELAGETRLADARIRKQQDDSELSGSSVLKLAPQLRQLGTSAHELGRPSHRRKLSAQQRQRAAPKPDADRSTATTKPSDDLSKRSTAKRSGASFPLRLQPHRCEAASDARATIRRDSGLIPSPRQIAVV